MLIVQHTTTTQVVLSCFAAEVAETAEVRGGTGDGLRGEDWWGGDGGLAGGREV